ncbi:MAG: hypothetical protein HYZ26_14595 [Chloroflexi bacterium]|nr:hypothetical protein [Chloroflexota bacterium]
MSQPQQLYQLQQVDSALDQARARLDEIEIALNHDETLARAESQLEAARATHHEAHTALRSAEEDVQAQQEKVGSNQKALYGGGVTNPKELEDLQQEAAALQRHLNTLEERQLQAMLVFEETEAALQAAQTHAESTRGQSLRQNDDLAAEQKSLLARMAELEGERERVLADIDAKVLELYKELRGTRAGLAVATVDGPECPACGATLTAAVAQAARTPSQLARCDDCGRILVSARP